ncbi:hypothetical protein H6P81_018480 [Aristolochia fimbriata]|uniref:Uncharacterized protein n=1 Tax=Aristolochia fimbriata TaxID=158543 RepID=A0AAV7E2R7_ARIFI|nr:hypothetical protein H6P81_018480 [Aristolochia fimbriata]
MFQALLFGGSDSLPAFLSRVYIPWLDIVVDHRAAILVLLVTLLLCVGIKEPGGYLGIQTGWAGYNVPSRLFPFGVNGMLAGSATVFFSYIGFDSVASTAEKRVSLLKKVYVIYNFIFVPKVIAHIVTFVFYCVVMPASVLVPEVDIPKWA